MKHLWQQQLCDRQPQPQQSYVSLFLFVALLWWGIPCALSQFTSLQQARYCFLSIGELWEAHCTPHSEHIPFLLQELPHEPDSCLDEVNGKFTPNFSNCRINLQAQCNRDSSEFKATLTSVAVLTSAIDLKRVSEDELFFFFFLLLFFLNQFHSFFFSDSVFPLEGRDLSALKESY